MRFSLLFAISLSLASCITLDKERLKSPHYRDGRFQNLTNDDDIAGKGFLTVLKWKILGPSDEPAIENIPDRKAVGYKIKPEEVYPAGDGVRITFIGHATALIAIQKGGKRTVVITDPIFGGIVTQGRKTELPIKREEFPPVDYAVVSHSHFDHCDLDTLRFLQQKNKNMVIIMPEGFRPWAEKQDLVNIKTLAWWQSQKAGLAKIHSTPAHHWGMRGLNDRMQFHWASYVIETSFGDVYFAGDTGWSDHFAEISKRFPRGFEAALIPIGAYAPRWFMKAAHINPPEAIKANQVLNSRQLLPIHWSTFEMADEELLEPILYLEQELKKNEQPAMLWRTGLSYGFGVIR